MDKTGSVVSKFLKKFQSGKRKTLPWISESIMKQRDQALIKAMKVKSIQIGLSTKVLGIVFLKM